MLILEFFIALLIAFLLTIVFSRINRVGPWSGFLWFFLIVLLTSWAGGVWVEPYGPAVRGVYWVPYLFFGVMLALLLAAVMPYEKPKSQDEARQELEENAAAQEVSYVALNIFFFIFMIGLILALVVHYIK